MLLKNKILFKRIFAIIFPIALVVGVSCFFFINVDWDKYTAETWRQMIITWILSYGGIILLFVKAFLTAISAKNVLSKKTVVSTVKDIVDTTTPIKDKELLNVPKIKLKPYFENDLFVVYKKNNELTIYTKVKLNKRDEYLNLKNLLMSLIESYRKELPTQLI